MPIRLRDDGIEFSNAAGTGVVKWDTIFRWRQEKDYLLVYPMPSLYYIIPQSIREHGAELEPFIDALRSNVGNEA